MMSSQPIQVPVDKTWVRSVVMQAENASYQMLEFEELQNSLVEIFQQHFDDMVLGVRVDRTRSEEP